MRQRMKAGALALVFFVFAPLCFALPSSIKLAEVEGRAEFFELLPLGWSRTGKAALLVYESEESMEDTVAAAKLVIVNAVTDEVTEYYRETVKLDTARKTLEAYYARRKAEIGKTLTAAGIVLETAPNAGAFPYKAAGGLEYSGRLDLRYKPEAATNFWDRLESWSYAVRSSAGTEKGVVQNEAPKKSLSGVASMGYWKSPYENRLLSIVVFYWSAVEAYRPVPVYYGSLLTRGFAAPAIDPKEGEWVYEAVLELPSSPVIVMYTLKFGWPNGVFSGMVSAEGYQTEFAAPLQIVRTAKAIEFRYLPPFDQDEDPLADVFKSGDILFSFVPGETSAAPKTVFGALLPPGHKTGDTDVYFTPVE